MKSERIAKRYAKALFGLVLEKDKVEQVYNDMLLINDVCTGSPDFIRFLQSPVINFSKKVSVFNAVFSGKLNPVSFEFLVIILKKNREMILGEISAEFIRLYKEYKNIKTVYLKTATPTDEKNAVYLKEILSRTFSSDIELIQEVDKNLIGGFVFKMNDLQYDATVRRNINRLKKEYNVNIYVPKF